MDTDTDKKLDQLVDNYRNHGYQVVIRPGSDDLPPFAQGFKVELLGKRAGEGVLVAVKKNYREMAADAELPRYAEVTGKQKGWRFDFAILEPEDPRARELEGAKELAYDDVIKALSEADELARLGHMRPALVTAWAGFEAAMRRRLPASRKTTGSDTEPRQMVHELYSSGILSFEEFPRLEKIYRLRNEAVHGFASPNLEVAAVQLLTDTARRLLEESLPAKRPA